MCTQANCGGNEMLDDVAEKARRNLLVVSSGILAVWALGIPLDGKLVGAVDLSAVEPWRAWLAATAVLTYVAARYYFSPEAEKAWRSWRYRRRTFLTRSLTRTVEAALKEWPAQVDYVSFTFTDHAPEQRPVVHPQDGIRVKGRHGEVHHRWSNKSVTFKAPVGTDIIKWTPTAGDEMVVAKLTFPRRIYLRHILRAYRRAYEPSWDLLELSFPWFLAAAALLVCIWRLVVSLYYSFPFVRQLLPA